MTRSTFDQFKKSVSEAHQQGHSKVVAPVYRRLSADMLTPVAAYLKLCEDSRFSFLFESVEGGEQLARYSFLGHNPYRVFRAFGADVFAEAFEDGVAVPTIDGSLQGNIFEVLQTTLDEWHEIKDPDLPRLTCGAVGFMGYDNVRLLEQLPPKKESGLDLPDAVWCLYDTIVAFDHVKHQLILIASVFAEDGSDLEELFNDACRRLDGMEQRLRSPRLAIPDRIKVDSSVASSAFGSTAYQEAVSTAKEHIREGDIFQVVLSRRFAFPFEGHPFNLYRALRQVNPSPYLFYLQIDDYQLIGSSPEVLVRVEESVVEVLPIAGTRPRGATPGEDRAYEEDLLSDAKENAEHLMLVDLGRNDIGRIADYGTVQVDRFATVERYSHVMHLVSSVSGTLAERYSAVDALGACFPAGTVSGAPKVRAMEIINDLEPESRGIYAGAVGYLDFSGNMDTCIAIRTMITQDSTIYIQAGAGIVADSDPQAEFDETENKARALREAIEIANDDLL